MNRKPFFAIALLLLSSISFSQKIIRGKVVNAADGTSIAGSSIFISNTSRGTVSDRDGNFELTDIPGGKQDLVVSSIGYETFAYSFTGEQLPLQLRIEMKTKVRELQNVTVEPSVEEGWDKWGRTFTENFVGLTPNSTSCTIKNQKAIRFRYYRKSNRLVAYSDEAILVENKALGYLIRYQLEDFEVNFSGGTTQFFGYPYFEDIDKDRKGLKKKWQKNREKAYNGSIMQFVRSIYGNTLLQDGFEIRRMVRVPNLEKERVKQIYKFERVVHRDPVTKAVTVTIEQAGPKDSVDYYRRIMDQKDYTEIYGRETLTADSLVAGIDGPYKIIFFTDYLYVTYKKELEDKAYLSFHMEGRQPTFQRSYLWLVNPTPVTIDVNGSYMPPQNVYSMGYWAWNEKMGDMLPLDFETGSQ